MLLTIYLPVHGSNSQQTVVIFRAINWAEGTEYCKQQEVSKPLNKGVYQLLKGVWNLCHHGLLCDIGLGSGSSLTESCVCSTPVLPSLPNLFVPPKCMV